MFAITTLLAVPHGRIDAILSHHSGNVHHVRRLRVSCAERREACEVGLEVGEVEAARRAGRHMIFKWEVSITRRIAPRRRNMRGVEHVGVDQ